MNGNFLKERLQSFDIQLVELAKKLHISPQTLQSRFKTKDVTVNFLLEICSAINKSPYSLLRGSIYEKVLFSDNYSELENNSTKKDTEQIGRGESNLKMLIDVLQNQISELKQDKEDLKNDKALLTSLVQTKLGNQEAS